MRQICIWWNEICLLILGVNKKKIVKLRIIPLLWIFAQRVTKETWSLWLYIDLQGSDPSTYEMIQKIQTLQKRLISKTEEVVEKELLIQEKEKLYLELKHILARQPGPEVAEQLTIYQQTLKEKTKQMKVMPSCTFFFFF